MKSLGTLRHASTSAWVVTIWVMGLMLAVRSEGQSFSLSPERMFDVMLTARDCSVYRGALYRAVAEQRHRRGVVGDIGNAVRERRATFEACAADRGVGAIADERAEQLGAELCPESYADYVRVSLRMVAMRQDLKAAISQVQLMQQQIRDFCPELPESAAE